MNAKIENLTEYSRIDRNILDYQNLSAKVLCRDERSDKMISGTVVSIPPCGGWIIQLANGNMQFMNGNDIYALLYPLICISKLII